MHAFTAFGIASHYYIRCELQWHSSGHTWRAGVTKTRRTDATAQQGLVDGASKALLDAAVCYLAI